MPVYRRAKCPQCKKHDDLRNGKDKLKKIVCRGCGGVFEITTDNSICYIDYSLPNGRRRREAIGPDRKLAEIVLGKRKAEIREGKHLDIDKKEDIRFEDFADEYVNIHSKQHKKSWETDFHILKNFKKHFGGKYLYYP